MSVVQGTLLSYFIEKTRHQVQYLDNSWGGGGGVAEDGHRKLVEPATSCSFVHTTSRFSVVSLMG